MRPEALSDLARWSVTLPRCCERNKRKGAKAQSRKDLTQDSKAQNKFKKILSQDPQDRKRQDT